MNQPQVNLKLFLDILDIPSNISILSDKKRVQNAVYIGQSVGADLGYEFGWYTHGSYSPELNKDHIILSNDILTGDYDYANYDLNKSISDKLENIKDLIKVPKNVRLSQSDWLELLALIIYFKRQNMVNTKIIFQNDSLMGYFLVGYFNIALNLLKQHGLKSIQE